MEKEISARKKSTRGKFIRRRLRIGCRNCRLSLAETTILPNTIQPGEFLLEILSDRGISQSHLAKHIGVEAGVTNLICRGKRGVSAAMAKKLARALWTDPELWVNLQSSYDLTLAEDPQFGKLRA